MKHGYLTNESPEVALTGYIKFLEEQGMKPASERVSVQNSLGRVTASAVYAVNSSPHYNASAMDGIALKASLTFGASETTPVSLTEGIDFTVVDTGDMLPDGCDCVVMVEDVVRCDGHIKLFTGAAPWQHIRQIGEDICQGDMLIPSLTAITPFSIGAMLAGGVGEVEVVTRPLVGIIPTGDEIVPPCAHPQKGEIIDFNSAIFSSMLEGWGCTPKTFPIVKDDLGKITTALQDSVDECDCVLVIAGSSAGREDYTSSAIATVGSVYLHGLAIKPGKPAILGSANAKPIIGLPGYPVSGIIVMEKVVGEVLRELTLKPKPQEQTLDATLTRHINSSLKYREFIRMRVGEVGGKFVATALNRGAGVVTSLVKADALLEVDQNSEGLEQGSAVKLQLLKPLGEIQKAIAAIGSHDPLLDEIGDIMQLRRCGYSVASAHVGSMGGIMAIKRGEAHLGGIHLLDEDGNYNESYIKKYFPQGGVARICGVKRTQGFIVQKGNPKGIRTWEDVAKEGVSYVNRQKGSGTRILCDHLIKREGIDPSLLYGYEREEYTHTAIGAIIASDSADVGLGIYCAARIFDLDFVPLCQESYDLLVTLDALKLQSVQTLIEIMKSDEFAARLSNLGGYELDEINILY